jgi:hypothetical protein
MSAEKDQNQDCIICLESLTAKDEVLACGHIFHHDCLKQQFKPTCPLCRKPFQMNVEGVKPIDPLIEEFAALTIETPRPISLFRQRRSRQRNLVNAIQRVHSMIGRTNTILGNVIERLEEEHGDSQAHQEENEAENQEEEEGVLFEMNDYRDYDYLNEEESPRRRR